MVYMRDIWPIGHPKILYRPKRRRVWRYQRSNQNPSRHICYVQQTNIILLRYDIWPICSRDTIYGQYVVGIRFQGTWFHSKFVWNRLCLCFIHLFYISSFRLVVCVYIMNTELHDVCCLYRLKGDRIRTLTLYWPGPIYDLLDGLWIAKSTIAVIIYKSISFQQGHDYWACDTIVD